MPRHLPSPGSQVVYRRDRVETRLSRRLASISPQLDIGTIVRYEDLLWARRRRLPTAIVQPYYRDGGQSHISISSEFVWSIDNSSWQTYLSLTRHLAAANEKSWKIRAEIRTAFSSNAYTLRERSFLSKVIGTRDPAIGRKIIYEYEGRHFLGILVKRQGKTMIIDSGHALGSNSIRLFDENSWRAIVECYSALENIDTSLKDLEQRLHTLLEEVPLRDIARQRDEERIEEEKRRAKSPQIRQGDQVIWQSADEDSYRVGMVTDWRGVQRTGAGEVDGQLVATGSLLRKYDDFLWQQLEKRAAEIEELTKERTGLEFMQFAIFQNLIDNSIGPQRGNRVIFQTTDQPPHYLEGHVTCLTFTSATVDGSELDIRDIVPYTDRSWRKITSLSHRMAGIDGTLRRIRREQRSLFRARGIITATDL